MRRTTTIRPALLGAIAALAVLLLGACGSTTSSSSSSPAPTTTIPTVTAGATATTMTAFYTPPTPLPPGPAGSLIRAEVVTGVPGVPAGATVWRILYHSRSIYGADIAVSGYVLAPGGTPPAGGFPVLAWAHGTTGVADSCAPSLFRSAGSSGPSLVPDLSLYLTAGFVVAATDYEGLGTPGLHPYLLGQSEGQGVLDAARAARQLPALSTSTTVLIYGHSQGGQAALFAGELAAGYAPDLHVVGVVAAAPATNLSTIVAIADNPAAGGVAGFELLASYTWAETYRDLPLSSVLTPAGQAFAAAHVDRECANQVDSDRKAAGLGPTTLFPASAATDPVVLAHAKLNDPGRARTGAPILVVQGTADQTVPPALTDLYVASQACPIGDTVDYLHVTGATHGTVVTLAGPTIVAWLTARLAGTAPPSTCGQPGSVSTLTP
jgi:alpha-beta hydrolase superfamily lysophospholipase